MTGRNPRFQIELEALPRAGLDPNRRLARLLKAALRSFGFRCRSASHLPVEGEQAGPGPGAVGMRVDPSLIGAWAQLGGDERAVLLHVASGLVHGRRVYGELDLVNDKRDMPAEALAEVRDALVYVGAALVRLQRMPTHAEPAQEPRTGPAQGGPPPPGRKSAHRAAPHARRGTHREARMGAHSRRKGAAFERGVAVALRAVWPAARSVCDAINAAIASLRPTAYGHGAFGRGAYGGRRVQEGGDA